MKVLRVLEELKKLAEVSYYTRRSTKISGGELGKWAKRFELNKVYKEVTDAKCKDSIYLLTENSSIGFFVYKKDFKKLSSFDLIKRELLIKLKNLFISNKVL